MADTQTPPKEVDFDRLATYLKALSNPVRLEILWRLRIPAPAAAVSVRPRRRDDLSPMRPVSRQTIAAHLERLNEVGIVRRLEDAPGRGVSWVSNIPRLFALLQDMEQLTRIPAHDLLEREETTTFGTGADAAWPAGPKVVLVGGPWDGRAFPLTGGPTWRVGRSRKLEVPISYDPFVSSVHATIERTQPGFIIRSEQNARNPVRLNYAPVVPGEAAGLESGDVVGVGRSILLFRGS